MIHPSCQVVFIIIIESLWLNHISSAHIMINYLMGLLATIWVGKDKHTHHPEAFYICALFQHGDLPDPQWDNQSKLKF